MTRTVVAIENARLSDTVCAALEHCGIAVRFRCRTGAEAIRAVKKMGGGVIICSFRLPDMSAYELGQFVQGEAYLLVAAKPQYLSDCVGGDVYPLPLPAKCGELAGAAEKLIELDNARANSVIARRTEAEKQIIEKAKALIMEKDGLSEAAAHRYLQRRSMDNCMPLAQTAKSILETYGK